MITLTLLDPQQRSPRQQWHFEQETTIQIGRSDDNHIVLKEPLLSQELAGLISRHHLILQQVAGQEWRLTNQGSNGTYIDGAPVQQSSIANGTQFQLARGGPIFQVQIQTATGIPAVQPPPTVNLTSPAIAPSVEPEAVASLQAQLTAVTQERDRLQGKLQEIQAQLPLSSLTARQTDLTQQSGQLQKLHRLLQEEITQLQALPPLAQQPGDFVFTLADRDRLIKSLSAALTATETQQQELRQSRAQVQAAIQALEALNLHVQANQAIAAQLPPQQTRTEAIAAQIQQALQEFDQELARIHELHATANSKQFFTL